MIFGYVRTKVNDDDAKEFQEIMLEKSGATKIFYDVGTKGNDLYRPGFQQLIRSVKRGDTIIVTKYHILVKGFPEEIIVMDELIKLGVAIKELQGTIDTSNIKFIKTHKSKMKFFEDLEKEAKEKGWDEEIEEKV